MRPRRRLAHLLALLFALAQGLVPAAAALADGALATARGDRAGAHVEALGGSSGCQQVHTDACGLCRLLSLPGTPPPAVGVLGAAAGVAARLPWELAPRRGRAYEAFALARGPPAA